MVLENSNPISDLTGLMNEIVERSNALNIPLSIAFEVDQHVELLTNKQPSNTEEFRNIIALHESQGRVSDFLLEICKVNNVKSDPDEIDYTITSKNPRTKH